MKKTLLNQITPYLVALILFLIIPFVYFSPVLEGKKLQTHDISMHKGMSKEIADFREQTGQEALWTNSMFGGMPAFQISVLYKGNLSRYIDKFLRAGLPHPVFLLFLYFIGFFVLLRVLKVNPWLSIAGAIAFAFSSYFLIILAAGHNSKAHAIAYMAPVFAGIILTYRGQYRIGAALTALATALELQAGHPQITYYLVLLILIFGIFQFTSTFRKKTWSHFFKASVLLLFAGLLGASTHLSNLWATMEYGEDSIRGKTELTTEKQNRTSGLDRDYATQWSYGKMETFTFLIPNAYGGASGALAEDAKALEKVEPQYKRMIGGASHYWGDQPMTAGPVYIGAFLMFLFVLGLLIVEGRLKWVLLTATLLSIALAWGHNMMWFTNLFLDYFPGYNKFRAVAMTLVIAEFCIPLLAILAVNKIVNEPGILKIKKRAFYTAFGLTGGLSLLFFLFPTAFFNFFSEMELMQFEQFRQSGNNAAQIDQYMYNLELARISIFKADAIRSFLFILAGAAIVYFFAKEKLPKTAFYFLLPILFLADQAPICYRYLNNDNFTDARKAEHPFPKTQADQFILQDPDLSYRVFNTTVSPFNDASTSYYHKSVGGYHGAKLRRYQELIDYHLSKNNMKVFNMLNTKYFIVNEGGKPSPRINGDAMGNAWFVSHLKMVNNADEEIMELNTFNPKATAIVDQRFADQFNETTFENDPNAKAQLVKYQPNYLAYQVQSATTMPLIFSEIYYNKGWEATIDGEPAKHFRANYVLRGMQVPAGKHLIEFRFHPQVYYTGEKISRIASILLFLLVGTVAFIEIRKRLHKSNSTARA